MEPFQRRQRKAYRMLQIPFIAYAGDCLVYAKLDFQGGRLSDHLNERGELALTEARLQDREDGRTVTLDELTLSLDDIFAIEAHGPRGSQERRIRTNANRLEFDLGAYQVMGQLHTKPGADPVSAMMRRQPFLPLTASTIAFRLAGSMRMRDVGTLIINRRHIVSVHEPAFDAASLEVIAVPDADPRAKDLTGWIHTQ